MSSTIEHHVKVQTIGICTYFEPAAAGLREMHRVVLVNASDPSRFPQTFRDLGVDAHEATLQILAEDFASSGLPPAREWFPIIRQDDVYIVWKLSGVIVTVENAVAAPASAPDSCVPHLRLFSAEGHLPPPGPATLVADREKTACWFDYPPSALEGKTLPPGGAAIAVLTIMTSARPTIVVRPFGGGEPVFFEVRSGAEISLSNIPADDSTDKNADFLLHFLTLNALPAAPTFPHEPFVCAPLVTRNLPVNLKIDELTVAGCSNSNYP